jgi:hypothetical protein
MLIFVFNTPECSKPDRALTRTDYSPIRRMKFILPWTHPLLVTAAGMNSSEPSTQGIIPENPSPAGIGVC